ncbi:DUF3618 domain-containing protein [Nocardioides marmoriginsengisoli]|uniref:DUF3618 domain-containing protein n=1 Tax=Nocardioides marmoriginsengisoli TaxID=661483 RepID=A0A3N0CJ95_9ACTN|nr:DUF3618 domain-containing protein [Nocardioides marmoriginsengisoli]RNL63409.1 DUF3618 domain-containing protein [Nocardioides marmoriginsengisoli]
MAEKNLSSIESDIALTRERLASTIDQLAYRTSPKTIAKREVNQVKGYFVDANGAPRQDNIIKVVGGVAGVIVVFALIRKIVK